MKATTFISVALAAIAPLIATCGVVACSSGGSDEATVGDGVEAEPSRIGIAFEGAGELMPLVKTGGEVAEERNCRVDYIRALEPPARFPRASSRRSRPDADATKLRRHLVTAPRRSRPPR